MMMIYEIGTGYTSIPARVGAATEIVAEELAAALIKDGDSVAIVDIYDKKRPENELPILEVKVPKAFTKTYATLGFKHMLKRVVYSLCLARKLKRILKQTEEKVVLHFHNQYNLFFFLKFTPKKLLKKATVVYTVHSYIWGAEWNKIEKIINTKYFQEIFCIKHADKVLVLNDLTAEHFVNHLGLEKTKIIKVRNGVNAQKYFPISEQEIEHFKSDMGFENKKIIFQVGSVCERKNQLGAVKMLVNFLRSNPDVCYIYAGGIMDENYQNDIIEFAKVQNIENQVKYVGEIAPGEELNRYYNAASCSIFPSNLESFGLVVIESISAGTPVLVGGKLMFELGGGYSIYNNEDEFILLLEKALNTDKRDSDCSKFAQDYSWDKVAKQHSNIFSK